MRISAKDATKDLLDLEAPSLIDQALRVERAQPPEPDRRRRQRQASPHIGPRVCERVLAPTPMQVAELPLSNAERHGRAGRHLLEHLHRIVLHGLAELYEGPGPRLLPPGAITALRIVGHDVEVELPADKDVFTVGSKPGAVDVVLPLKQISRLQALGQRDGTWVTFRDQGSSNGQFLNDRPEATIHIAAGQVFRWANVDVIALDDHLRDLRDRLAWFLGFAAHARVDAALALAAHDGPIPLTARKTCQPTALARAIHRASGRRAEPFRVLDVTAGIRQADIRPIFAQASRGTVYLDLCTLDGPAPDHLAKWLVGTDYGVRAVVTATAADQARKHLDHYAMRFAEIEVPTIATRRQDVPRLLDGHLREPRRLTPRRRVGPPPPRAVRVLLAETAAPPHLPKHTQGRGRTNGA